MGAQEERRDETTGNPSSGPPSLHGRKCLVCRQIFSSEARFCPFDGERLLDAPEWNPQADPLNGQIIDGRYKVLSVLGEGGTGKVYKVQHVALGRRFALKVLRHDVARDPDIVARFIREAQAAADIGHPNIIAVSDFGEIVASGVEQVSLPYFVMEYLSGLPLAHILRNEGALSPVRAGPILLQAASALAAAHTAGVIHRDMKPANIFVTPSGGREFVKLLDFGVAKIAGSARLTKSGIVFGTPHYMSPEQASGQPVDHRTDIYSLGVIMYQCFAGRVPFEGETYAEVLKKHVNEAPDPIEVVAAKPRALGGFGAITMRCLAKDPKDRFASMGELCAAIEAALAPMRGSGPRSLRRKGASGARSWGVRGAAFAGALAVVLLGAYGAQRWRASSAAEGEEQQPSSVPAEAPPAVEVEPPVQQVSTVVVPAVTSSTPTSSTSITPAQPEPSSGTPPMGGALPRGQGARSTTGKAPGKVTGAPVRPPSSGGGEIVDPWKK